MSNLRDSSRSNWTSDRSVEHINAGSLQRIADATEKMAANYTAMQESRDMYKRWYEEERVRVAQRDHQIRGLRGALTRAKRKAVA